MIEEAREAPRIPSPEWERGRGEGRTVQEETLRLALLTTGFALFGEGLPSPLTLSHPGEGDASRFPTSWIILRDACCRRLLRMRSARRRWRISSPSPPASSAKR
jgi:hypothetical protein